MTNSSPAYRTQLSYGRMAPRMTCATSRSARSPTGCPKRSLIDLNSSMSMTSTETSDSSRAARASSRARCANMNRAFGRPVSGSVSESCLACSNTSALLITPGRLLGDAIEQPPVILGEGRRRRWRTRPACPTRRSRTVSGDTSEQTSVVSFGDPRCLEIGSGPCVQERAAVRPHPADDTLTLLDDERPQQRAHPHPSQSGTRTSRWWHRRRRARTMRTARRAAASMR